MITGGLVSCWIQPLPKRGLPAQIDFQFIYEHNARAMAAETRISDTRTCLTKSTCRIPRWTSGTDSMRPLFSPDSAAPVRPVVWQSRPLAWLGNCDSEECPEPRWCGRVPQNAFGPRRPRSAGSQWSLAALSGSVSSNDHRHVRKLRICSTRSSPHATKSVRPRWLGVSCKSVNGSRMGRNGGRGAKAESAS
jgi:hypothetical protein